MARCRSIMWKVATSVSLMVIKIGSLSNVVVYTGQKIFLSGIDHNI